MLAENIVHFARVLRASGMPVGPDRVLAAIAAVEAVGLDRRDDVHAALGAVMLDRHEQQLLFDAAFDAFWRDPKLLEQMMLLLLPKVSGGEKVRPPRPNRLAEALAAPAPAEPKPAHQTAQEEVQFETTFSFSDRERLHDEVRRMAQLVSERLRNSGLSGRTVTAKLRYSDFSIRTRSTTLPAAVDDAAVIGDVACGLLDRGLRDRPGALRLVGVGVSGLSPYRQLTLDES